MDNTPTFIIIAGPNGAGKTTFALDYLKLLNIRFINADLIATGLSPISPDEKQFTAARIMLQEIKYCVDNNISFAVETTLSSHNYLKLIQKLQQNNWNIELIYLYLPTVESAINRVAERVKDGGHNIPLTTIKRRYPRSLANLVNYYLPVVNKLICLLNTKKRNDIIFAKEGGKIIELNTKLSYKILHNDS